MASCLLECLCEAELGQYYPHFLAMGLQKIEELAEVTMKDYSKLGVHSMEDRKRLFQLIKIIQSVAAEDSDGRTPLQPGCVYLQPPHNRSATRRQLQFDFSYETDGDEFPSSKSFRNHFIKHPAEICDRAPPVGQYHGQRLPTAPEEESPAEGSRLEALRGTAPGLRDTEGPVIHRVMHVSGYNYGVPQTHLRGNAACFAYGQTGAGKTYTMIGTQKNPGLYALAARDIFQQLESSQPRKDQTVWISFFEIYCGQLYDLLDGRKRLHAREDGKHVVQVVGLREVQVKNVDFLLEMILKGSRERSTGATGVNSDSSRSHAVIQIQIKDGGSRKLGRMSFIDLAGSERASDARESDKQTKMEGAEINQSLLALKECIRALDQEQAHTPFRQSKLTQVLKDSFIGNAKTCMIANISPSHIATEHTLNTLRYADRVKELKKGMRCTTSCTNRSRSASGFSPKRVQNSSSMPGEKISPKKVKLGLQHPSTTSNTLKSKSYPSVFHPSNIPLSSTPKTCTKPNTVKGSPGQAWIAHTTPVKGFIKIGKKKTENNQDQNPTPRNPCGNKSQMSHEFRENNFSHSRQNLQRVQAVQPVQKQIVPRAGTSLENNNTRAFSSGDGPVRRNASSDLGVLPEQKEREERLRFYHQQFQHPPILHQKLQYQPLEKILDRYKPQEVTVGHIISPTPPCEGQSQEDPDDSDFSEDSFSYASNQKKGRKEEMVRERLSFFLHQGSPNTEIRKCSGRGQGLCFNYSESREYKNMVSCNCASGCGLAERKRTGHGDHSSWSSQDDSTSAHGSSDISNTPEKPYSSHEDLPNQLKKKKDPSVMPSPVEDVSSAFGPLQEQGDRTLPLLGAQAARAMLSSMDAGESMNKSSDSASELMPPLTVSLLQDNWSLEATPDLEPHESSRSDGGAGNTTSEKDAAIDSHTNDRSVENNLSALVKQMLRYNESLHAQNSQQRAKDRPPEANNGSQPCSGGSPSSRQNSSFSISDSSYLDVAISRSGDLVSHYYDADTEESSSDPKKHEIAPLPRGLGRKTFEETVEAAKDKHENNLTPNKAKADVFKVITSKPSKCNGSPTESDGHYQESPVADTDCKCSELSRRLPFRDCDLEHLKNRLMKCLFPHHGIQDEKMPRCAQSREESSSRTNVGTATQLQPIHMNVHQDKSLEKAQQLIVQAHCKALNEMSALCTEEEMLLSRVSNTGFQDYVKKLDEILAVKCRHIESLRAQLQMFLGYSSAESSARSSVQEHNDQEVIDCLCCS
ncbi:kinesin-like protein KIF24 isoform X2 [Pseudophryne corroboree]|uniref:kinesin-like protein KIF24 isoform X2 n=1 Tax=Pseudophryne corroboree TaxID=495146 RepID=UPI003081DB78